jgi:hypothetical protein
MRNFIICTHPPISLASQVKANEVPHVARMGEDRRLYKVLAGKPEGKIPLGRPRRRWEDGIRMDLWGVDWIRLAQDRDQWLAIVSAVMNLRVLSPRRLFVMSIVWILVKYCCGFRSNVTSVSCYIIMH